MPIIFIVKTKTASHFRPGNPKKTSWLCSEVLEFPHTSSTEVETLLRLDKGKLNEIYRIHDK